PPITCSSRVTAITGAGASGETRDTSPYTKLSSIRSPMQRTVRSDASRSASSNVNMPLPKPIALVEEGGDVTLDRILERREAGIIAGALQLFDRGLRKILITIANRVRHGDVFDIGCAPERGKHRSHHFAKPARLARPDVEQTRGLRRLDEPAHHRDGVVHIDEVAPLIAVADAVAIGLEQAHRIACLRLVEALGDQAHHLAFVILVGPEYVEELEAGPLRRQRRAPCGTVGDHEIEQMLAPSIEVERPQPPERNRIAIIGKTLGAVSVGGGRRCIN